MKVKELKGKVAAILDNYTVVLNIGREDGVDEGMKLVIYELGDKIKDPDTEGDLGQLEIVKGFVEVINAQPKISTAKSYEERTESIPTIWSPRQVTRIVRLPVSKKTIDISDHIEIKVGDLVRVK